MKFTEDFIKGIVNGVVIVKSGMLPAGYNLAVNNYNGMNHVLLQVDPDIEKEVDLDTLQSIRCAIQRIFNEECDVKIVSTGVVFSILERDEY